MAEGHTIRARIADDAIEISDIDAATFALEPAIVGWAVLQGMPAGARPHGG